MTIKNKLKSDIKQIQMICDYLIKECENDKHLSERVMLDNKTVGNMYQYILNTVQNNYEIVNNGVYVAPEDVYNMAIHYFIEDDEVLEKEFPKKVTKKEVKAKTKPVKTVKKEIPKPKEEPKNNEQLSLFDFGNDG